MALYKDKRTGIWYVSYTDPAGRRVRKSLETKNRNVAAIKEGEYLTRRKASDTVRVPLDVFFGPLSRVFGRHPQAGYRAPF